MDDLKLRLVLILSIFFNRPANEYEQNSQLMIFIHLVNNKKELVKGYLVDKFKNIFKIYNFLLIEFIVKNSVINVNQIVDGTPDWFKLIEMFIKDQHETDSLFLIKSLRVILTKVQNIEQKDTNGKKINHYINKIKGRAIKHTLFKLLKGDIYLIKEEKEYQKAIKLDNDQNKRCFSNHECVIL